MVRPPDRVEGWRPVPVPGGLAVVAALRHFPLAERPGPQGSEGTGLEEGRGQYNTLKS